AEVEAVGDAQWTGPGAGDVARGLRDRRLAALIRIEQHMTGVAVHRHCQADVGALDGNDTGVTTRSYHAVAAHSAVELLIDPTLAGNGRRVEQLLEGSDGVRFVGNGTQQAPRPGRVRLDCVGGVDRAAVHQLLAGDRCDSDA